MSSTANSVAKPWLDDGDLRLYHGDALEVLRGLPAGIAQTCVTSPPYWGLRDYSVTGQLGLEATPQQYVENMVALFREVRRVLRDDGTLWLNLGDSFYSSTATQGRNENRTPTTTLTGHGADGRSPALDAQTSSQFRRTVDGLKPKDLVMVPFRVAAAMQEPYYAGTIRRLEDRTWLAALIDGEGCIYISCSKVGALTGRDRKHRRTQNAYSAGITITNRNRRLLDRAAEIVGHGTVHQRGDYAEWRIFSSKAKEVLREIYPHLVAKQHEARLAYGCPPSGDKADAAHEALKILHGAGQTDVDFPSPPTCFEPGWYLRSDIIWSKPNPMPESVTDRPTKAHEYLFLFSKQPRYYWDADAIREDITSESSIARNRSTPRQVNGRQAEDPGSGVLRKDFGRTYAPDTAAGRNRRSVWTIPTQPFPLAHFATYPEELVRPCILAGTKPGDTVLDPFIGSGTTSLVARKHGRRSIGIDLSLEYLDLAAKRTQQLSLLGGVA